jgi:hypothetical protein
MAAQPAERSHHIQRDAQNRPGLHRMPTGQAGHAYCLNFRLLQVIPAGRKRFAAVRSLDAFFPPKDSYAQ